VKRALYTGLASLISLAYDKFTGRNLHGCRNILEKTQWMKTEELRQLQLLKLKVLLRHAYENVPYYHESFKKNGFRPDDLNRLEDIHRVPVLKRSELRLKSTELLARNAKKADLVPCETSGTTVTSVKFYQDKTEATWDMAAELRGFGWAGYKTGAKLAFVRRIRPGDVLASAKFKLECLVNRWKLLNAYYLSERSMASFSSKMHKFKPEYVLGATAPINIFAVFLLGNSQYKIRPKAVFTYAETLLPHYRRTIEEAFKCKVHDVYGSSEMFHVAAQCGWHEGHHITEENVLVETEKDGETAVPGEEGKVLLTNLNGFAMPFIRYDIGDRGKMFADECSCGRGLPLFRPIGRTNEYFVHSDGTFSLFHDLKTVFENLPIEDYQIVQPSYDEIIIRVVKRAGYTQAHTDFILRNIGKRIADIAKVKVELVDSLPMTGFGKIPHFVSKIPTRYT
jgi:phenylacetate-CoA ligase